MATTVQQALRYKLAIGAHPGYADRANFGRIELNLSPEEVADSVTRRFAPWPKSQRGTTQTSHT